MVNDIIGEIKKAEQTAKDTIESAKRDGEKIIDNAEIKAKEIKKSIDSEIRELIKDAEKAAITDAKKEIDKMKKENESMMAGIKKSIEKNKKNALNHIIKKVYE